MNWKVRKSMAVTVTLFTLGGLQAALGEEEVTESGPSNADDSASAPAVVHAEPAGMAVDHMDLEITSIRGNQELPKVLYIVPWKDPNLGDLTGRPVNSLVDEVLAPVDREVFRREVNYFEQLYGEEGN